MNLNHESVISLLVSSEYRLVGLFSSSAILNAILEILIKYKERRLSLSSLILHLLDPFFLKSLLF